MNDVQVLVLSGALSLMVLGSALVVLLTLFLGYKIDATYPELGFWANLRLDLASMLVGRLSK